MTTARNDVFYKFPSGRVAVFVRILTPGGPAGYGPGALLFKYADEKLGETMGERSLCWNEKNMHLLRECDARGAVVEKSPH